MTSPPTRTALGELFRSESGPVLATLVRAFGDLDVAEDAVQEAFAAALRQWPNDGMPENPRAWLIRTGRFKGFDILRTRSRSVATLESLEPVSEGTEWEDGVEDDLLRLILMCCHPELPLESQVALTLREVCGLTTDQVASAFLVAPSAMAQRLVRAKATIRREGLPFEVPEKSDLPKRLEGVLRVIYLVFNEGYCASSGPDLTRPDLSEEGIRLGRTIVSLVEHPEAVGLLALMLLQESRRTSRTGPSGEIVLLEDQDRRMWDRSLVEEGSALAKRALRVGPSGFYSLQAGIASVHARAATIESTDWHRIVSLYDRLLAAHPSSVVALNRAVAVAMREGMAAGIDLIDGLLADGNLTDYRLAHAARAELCRRSGRKEEAEQGFRQALELTSQEPERRILQRRLEGLLTE